MRFLYYLIFKFFKYYLLKCLFDLIFNGSEVSLINKYGIKIVSCEGYELFDYRSFGRR